MADNPQVVERTVDVLLVDLFDEIEAYRCLGPNWDGEEALPTAEAVAVRAKELLRRITSRAEELGVAWQSPSIAPNPQGGLELSWEAGERWVMLTVDPGRPDIECVTQTRGSEPEYEVVSIGDAIKSALWAMHGQ